MDDFFDKAKKLSHAHLRELTGLCSGAALLIAVAVFMSGGVGGSASPFVSAINPQAQTATILPCSFSGSCTYPPDIALTITPQENNIAPGTPVTFQWTASSYGANNWVNDCLDGSVHGSSWVCNITPDVPDQSTTCVAGQRAYIRNGVSHPAVPASGDCGNAVATVFAPPPGWGGYYTVNPGPMVTTKYFLCSNQLNQQFGVGCTAATITVVPPAPTSTPTTLGSFTATPSSIKNGDTSTLSWTGTPGTNFSSCQLTGGQWGAGAWFTTMPGSIDTDALTSDTTYNFNCYDKDGTPTGWKGATVTVAPIPPVPDSPTVSITADNAAPAIGEADNIHIVYTIAPDDTLGSTVINQSTQSGSVTAVPGSDQAYPSFDYVFTPSAKGVYTFTPYIATKGHPTLSNYGASVTLRVPGGDVCSNIDGEQDSVPDNMSVSGTTCTCNSPGYKLTDAGDSCELVNPPPATIVVTPVSLGNGITVTNRVRKGGQVALQWKVIGLNPGDTGTSCSVSASPSSAMATQTWDQNTTPWTQQGNGPIATINSTTVFTISCSNSLWPTPTISASATVNLIPEVKEI